LSANSLNEPPQLTFEKCALTSGLLTVQQLDEVRLALRRGDNGTTLAAPTDQQLAERFVEMGLLNAWQAKHLLAGQTKFTLGSYRIIDSLGQGGMGHVFKAEDPFLKRFVAIKVLPKDRSTPEAIANFTREIQALSSLNHPKLVRAVDAGNDRNVNFLVTEYVPGADLRKLVRRSGPLSMQAAANIISQVAEGLQHAHEAGIVHRDVKPGNVLVTPEGDAKLSDLGLAGPMYSANADQDPRYGKIVGTADYLSPDHIESPWSPVPAWDIYSLGCTLYYAVTGKVPFPGGTTSDKARAHRSLKPLDPRRLNHLLSDAFVDVVADMMAKEPAQRIPSAVAVIERLAPWAKEFQSQRQSGTGTVGPQSSPSGPSSRRDYPEAPAIERPIAASAVRSSVVSAEESDRAAAITPMEPLNLGEGPPLPLGDHGFAAPVVPPPVIAQPPVEWDWGGLSSGDSPPLVAETLLRDTLPDLPPGLEGTSDSEVSISLTVEPPRRMPIEWLAAFVLAPIVLTGLVLLLAWFFNVALF
jgi:eukaryotic-like serine/threonine-protein kinase